VDPSLFVIFPICVALSHDVFLHSDIFKSSWTSSNGRLIIRGFLFGVFSQSQSRFLACMRTVTVTPFHPFKGFFFNRATQVIFDPGIPRSLMGPFPDCMRTTIAQTWVGRALPGHPRRIAEVFLISQSTRNLARTIQSTQAKPASLSSWFSL